MRAGNDSTRTGTGGHTPPVHQRQPCEVYSRIVGYYRPIQQWNKGKRAEYRDRKVFNPPLTSGQDNVKIEGDENLH